VSNSSKKGAPVLVGVDCGLTVTKTVVFDLDGRPLGSHSVPARYRYPQEKWVENDPLEEWGNCAKAIRGALKVAAVDPKRIAAVGVTGHGDGAYLIGDGGEPVRAGIPALDTRADDIVRGWRERGVDYRALSLTGEAPFPQHAPAILAWLNIHEPEALDHARWIMFAKDWLKFKLTGAVTTDPTEASAGFTDVHTGLYARDVLELYGLSHVENKLPPVLPSMSVAGMVSPEAASETGLIVGTPVASGLHDVDASALGCGLLRPGELMLIAGTYSVNEVLGSAPAIDGRWLCRSWVVPEMWMHMATSPTSAVNLEWFVKNLCPSETARSRREGRSPFAFVDQEVLGVLDDESKVIYHPFLYGSRDDGMAHGAFLGLRSWHSRAHLLRALLEGVVFGHRSHVDALRSCLMVSSARLAGGARRSPVWAQLFADAMRLPIIVTNVDEEGALGAALCAGVAAELYPSLDEAAERAVHLVRIYEPNDAAACQLDEAYMRYMSSVDRATFQWRALA
jgi:L-xylulokinase